MTYEMLTQNSNYKHQCEKYNELYETYKPFMPDNKEKFKDTLQTNWVGASFEMYMALYFLSNKYPLKKPPSKGPDICLDYGDQKIWIECVAPTEGKDANNVERIEYGTIYAGDPEELKIKARLTGSFESKSKAFLAYQNDSIIAENDILIIGISTQALKESLTAVPMKDYLRDILFGLGKPYLELPIGTLTPLLQTEPVLKISAQHELLKESAVSGAPTPIEIAYFASSKYDHITAVIEMPNDLIHDLDLEGSALSIFINPFATKRLPPDFLPTVRKYGWESDATNAEVCHE